SISAPRSRKRRLLRKVRYDASSSDGQRSVLTWSRPYHGLDPLRGVGTAEQIREWWNQKCFRTQLECERQQFQYAGITPQRVGHRRPVCTFGYAAARKPLQPC